MKQIIVLIAICSMSLPSQSQDQLEFSENKHEINLGYFNAFELNGINELCIGYKRLINNGALRTSIGFNFFKYDDDYETEQHKNSGFEISPRVGYEFHQSYNRLRLHYGADVVSSIINSKSEFISDIPNSNRTEKSKGYQLGFRPVLGLTVFINKSISLSTETYLDFHFYKKTEERIGSTGTTTNTSNGLSMGLGPLGIVSVNFYF